MKENNEAKELVLDVAQMSEGLRSLILDQAIAGDTTCKQVVINLLERIAERDENKKRMMMRKSEPNTKGLQRIHVCKTAERANELLGKDTEDHRYRMLSMYVRDGSICIVVLESWARIDEHSVNRDNIR